MIKPAHKISLVVVLAFVVSSLGLACGGAGQGGGESGGKGSGYTIFMIPKATSISVFDVGRKGGEEAAKELGDTLEYIGPTEADAQQQVQSINNAVRQRPDAILVSALDPKALVPAMETASNRGVEPFTYDSDVEAKARKAFASPPKARSIGRIQVEMLGEQIGYKGKFAIITGAPTATNQNEWIKYMKEALKEPKYSKMELVKIEYAFDDDAKSAEAMQGLMRTYPDLKGVIAPTVVGIVAAARVVEQEKRCDDIVVTGLGLPNLTRPFVKSGCVKKFAFWNFVDLGYLSVQMTHAVLSGKVSGKEGETFDAGRLGKKTFEANNTVYLGKPIVFTKENIDKYDF